MVRDRLLADPRFLFLVVAEMAIDTGAEAVPTLIAWAHTAAYSRIQLHGRMEVVLYVKAT